MKAITYLGSQTEYLARIGNDSFVVVRQAPAANEPLSSVKPEDIVSLQWETAGLHD